MTTAQSAATLFVDLNRDTDALGISSYSSNAIDNYAIAAMSLENKATAKSAIGNLKASGSTNIGGGLQTSLNMIIAQGDVVSNEIIVLLSDGLHNTGTEPSAVIPALKTRGVKVYTIGLGSDVNESQMSDIATQTGGSYFYVSSIDSLQAHFNTIFTKIHNDGMILKLSEVIDAGGTSSHTAYVDTYTMAGGETTFVLSSTSSDLSLTVKRPDGTTVGESDADVIFYNKETQNEIYRISNPASGNWAANITSSSSSQERYDLQVASKAQSNVMVEAITDKPSYSSTEAVLVQASVRAPRSGGTEGERVAGAGVTAKVVLDDKEIGSFPLYDDGLPVHGDDKSNDGIYSGFYYPNAGEGSYAFDITVENQTGTTAPPHEEWPGWTPSPVDPFTRWAQVTVVVTAPPYTYLHLPLIMR